MENEWFDDVIKIIAKKDEGKENSKKDNGKKKRKLLTNYYSRRAVQDQ